MFASKFLFRIFLFVFIINNFADQSFAQFNPFGKFNFDQGGYVLLGLLAHHNDHKISKKLGNFYTDDVTVLNKIKQTWSFRKRSPMHACGYHYNILLLRHGINVGEVAINLSCHEIVTEDGSYIFGDHLLSSLRHLRKPLYFQEREFTSLEEARTYWKKMNSDSQFVYARRPDWIEFSGTFTFQVPCPRSDVSCSIPNDSRLEQLRKEIADAYPGEAFELNWQGGSTAGESFIQIRCNKSLEEKFKLYSRFDNVGFGKWQPFGLWLYAYWKSKPI